MPDVQDSYGGSGGRIALTCVRHSYASSAWPDWMLATTAGGGLNYGTSGSGASGTVYIDCGTRNRTLLVDNLNAGLAAIPAFIVDPAVSYSLQEIRFMRGGALTWQPMQGTNTTVVSTSAITGDATGTLTFPSQTVLYLASQPQSAMPGVAESALPTVEPVQTSSDLWTVALSRTYYVDDTNFSFASASVVISEGASLVSPYAITVVATTLTMAGTLLGTRRIAAAAGGTVSLQVISSSCLLPLALSCLSLVPSLAEQL